MSKTHSEIRIGISGWTYAPWRGVFYPKKLPHAQELRFASRQVNTIEINGSFYALQKPESYQKWYDSVPDDFIFSVKASRYITHTRRLRDIESPVANFFNSGILALREKLGPILWQFPPSMKYDAERFETFLNLLPRDTLSAKHLALVHRDLKMKSRSFVGVDSNRLLRHTIEVRNESFRNPGFFRLLKKYGVSLVLSHSTGAWPYFEELTSDFVYARLHGEGEVYSGGYGTRALNDWASKISSWSTGAGKRDVFLYFDNDTKVRAPFDAMELYRKLEKKLDLKPNEDLAA
jgi:uncharacterized protein YecE (DUF72 family)